MASVASNIWNVVKKGKKSKGQGNNLTKTQKKQFISNMPRTEPSDPVKESSTIYDAFVAKEQHRQFSKNIESAKEVPNGKGIADNGARKKPQAVKPRRTEPDRRKRPFEEVIKDVTEEELKSVLMQSKGHFPDKSELWLKDLVTYLNMKVENCIQNDSYLEPDKRDFPMSAMKKSCLKVLNGVIRDCSAATLEHVLYFCVVTMLEESQSGNATYGYKIFLQLIARYNPDVIIAKLSMYRDIVKSTQNKADKCLSVLWALGQGGVTSLKCGLRVWHEIMFPYLGLRSLGNYCVQYLEHLLSLHCKDLEKAGGEIKLREYFHLLDHVYGTSLPADLRKRLLAIYPLMKSIAYGKNPSNTLRNFFPSYLTRAMPDCSPALKTEVLSCLVLCLGQDKHTYSLWCQHYLKHLQQSRELMEHLISKWDSMSGSLDLKLLQQTMMTFKRTNEESPQGRNTGELGQMTAVCEELLKKLSRPRFPWRLVMFFLVTTVVAIVAYDVGTNKTLKDSRTVGFLEAYGVLGLLQQIWSQVCVYSGVVFGWLYVNVPIYSQAAVETMTPYVEQFVAFCYNIEEYTREYRQQASDKLYTIAPQFCNEAQKYMALALDYMIEYSYWIKEHIALLWTGVCLWVDQHIINGDFSSEHIQESLSSSAIFIKNAAINLSTWCQSFWTEMK